MPYENMTEREMLAELMEDKRRRDKLRWVKIAVAAVVLILVIVFAVKYIVPMSGYVKEIEASMSTIEKEVDAMKDQAQSIMNDMQSKLDEVDLEGLKSIAQKLEDIDFDSVKDTAVKFGNLVNKFPWLFK